MTFLRMFSSRLPIKRDSFRFFVFFTFVIVCIVEIFYYIDTAFSAKTDAVTSLHQQKSNMVTHYISDLLHFGEREYDVSSAYGDASADGWLLLNEQLSITRNVLFAVFGEEQGVGAHSISVFVSEPETSQGAPADVRVDLILKNGRGRVGHFVGRGTVNSLGNTKHSLEVPEMIQVSGREFQLKGTALEAVFDTIYSRLGNALVFELEKLIVVKGLLGVQSHNELNELIRSSENAAAIVFFEMYGSLDRDLAWETGRLIRDKGLATVIGQQGFVSSYAIDMFLAGKRRYAYEHASWVYSGPQCCFDNKLENHLSFDQAPNLQRLGYFTEMLGSDKAKGALSEVLKLPKGKDRAEIPFDRLLQHGIVTDLVRSGLDPTDMDFD